MDAAVWVLPFVSVADDFRRQDQAANRRRIGISDAHRPVMTWREYHEATKHSVESLSRMRQVLDWANMPDPFRHYEGGPVLDLPADPAAPEMPALAVLRGTSVSTHVGNGPTFLSQLLFYPAAISASKHVPSTGYRSEEH